MSFRRFCRKSVCAHVSPRASRRCAACKLYHEGTPSRTACLTLGLAQVSPLGIPWGLFSSPSLSGMACTSGIIFSKATSAVGWSAVVCAAFLFFYSAGRAVCCCARRAPLAAGRGACDIPTALPSHALFDSIRFAYGKGRTPGLHVGDGVSICAYAEPGSGKAVATPVLLRLGAVELDPPQAATWSSALSGRLHSGHFSISATAGPDAYSVSSPDGRALNWRLAVQGATWRSDFPASIIVRGSARDAPDLARGFASRPIRRLVAALLIEGLGAYAASAVEVSTTSAQLQATCRTWYARALTRSLSAGVLVSTFEYVFTAIVPISIERLPRKLFLACSSILLVLLSALALWALIVNATASPEALRSSFVVYGCTLAWTHFVLWPCLLLLSAGLWRDIPIIRDLPPPPPQLAPSFSVGAESHSVDFGGGGFGAGAKNPQHDWAAAVTPPPPLPTMPPTPPNADNPWAAGAEPNNPWARTASRGAWDEL